MFVQPCNVGVAAQKPQQLVDHRAQMQLLGRHQRKSCAQIKSQLLAEERPGAGTGAVLLGHALLADSAHEFQILSHGVTGPQVAARKLPEGARRRYAMTSRMMPP